MTEKPTNGYTWEVREVKFIYKVSYNWFRLNAEKRKTIQNEIEDCIANLPSEDGNWFFFLPTSYIAQCIWLICAQYGYGIG